MKVKSMVCGLCSVEFGKKGCAHKWSGEVRCADCGYVGAATFINKELFCWPCVRHMARTFNIGK